MTRPPEGLFWHSAATSGGAQSVRTHASSARDPPFGLCWFLLKPVAQRARGCYTAITGILPPASENHTLFPSLGETSHLRANVLPQRAGVRGDERESHGQIEKEKRQRRLGCVDAHLRLSLWMSVFVSETVHQANKVRLIGDITTLKLPAVRNEAFLSCVKYTLQSNIIGLKCMYTRPIDF